MFQNIFGVQHARDYITAPSSREDISFSRDYSNGFHLMDSGRSLHKTRPGPGVHPSTPAPKPCVKTPRFFFLLNRSVSPFGQADLTIRFRRSLFDVAELRLHKLHPCGTANSARAQSRFNGSRSPRACSTDPCPLDPRRLAPGPCACRDCCSNKEAALEGVVELRREGCDDAGIIRSARPEG
jgi:hypothetical protein